MGDFSLPIKGSLLPERRDWDGTTLNQKSRLHTKSWWTFFYMDSTWILCCSDKKWHSGMALSESQSEKGRRVDLKRTTLSSKPSLSPTPEVKSNLRVTPLPPFPTEQSSLGSEQWLTPAPVLPRGNTLTLVSATYYCVDPSKLLNFWDLPSSPVNWQGQLEKLNKNVFLKFGTQ